MAAGPPTWWRAGFLEYTTSRLSGVATRVTSERPSPDRMLFTLRQTAKK